MSIMYHNPKSINCATPVHTFKQLLIKCAHSRGDLLNTILQPKIYCVFLVFMTERF